MPKKSINVLNTLKRIQQKQIIKDQPLVSFTMEEGEDFHIFQSSGLNLLTGLEGHGKTKFLNVIALELLSSCTNEASPLYGSKILFIDTERAECQYAFSIEDIFERSELEELEFSELYEYMSVLDLKPQEIRDAILSHINSQPAQKFIVFIDPIIPLVHDMNSGLEASEVDTFIKSLICHGHLLIVSIHKTLTADKALGHLGSSLQRNSSCTVDISNSKERPGFNVKIQKSRIASLPKTDFFVPKDSRGNIDLSSVFVADELYHPSDPVKCLLAKEVFKAFIGSRTKSKKHLYYLIRTIFKMKKNSSNAYKVNRVYLKRFLQLQKDQVVLTEEGKILAAEYLKSSPEHSLLIP